MKVCWITINVIDMDESLDFYQEIIGLELNRKFTADVPPQSCTNFNVSQL